MLPIFFLVSTVLGDVPIYIDFGAKNIPGFKKRVDFITKEFESRLQIKWDSDDTITIRIAYYREDFEKLSGNGIPDWGIGAAIPSRDEIILLLDEGAMSGKALELLAHELAHIFLHKKTGDVVIPRWFDEGFAQWCSGPMKFEQSSRLSRAFIFGNTIPLATLNEVNGWNRESAELAYAESRAAFDMLLERVPESTPIYLFERIKEAGDFEVGFRDAMGITVYKFYRIWSADGARKFNYILLLADWRITFSALTILFVIFGTVKLVRLHMREKAVENEEN